MKYEWCIQGMQNFNTIGLLVEYKLSDASRVITLQLILITSLLGPRLMYQKITGSVNVWLGACNPKHLSTETDSHSPHWQLHLTTEDGNLKQMNSALILLSFPDTMIYSPSRVMKAAKLAKLPCARREQTHRRRGRESERKRKNEKTVTSEIIFINPPVTSGWRHKEENQIYQVQVYAEARIPGNNSERSAAWPEGCTFTKWLLTSHKR